MRVSKPRHPCRTQGDDAGGPTRLIHGSQPREGRSDPPASNLRAEHRHVSDRFSTEAATPTTVDNFLPFGIAASYKERSGVDVSEALPSGDHWQADSMCGCDDGAWERVCSVRSRLVSIWNGRQVPADAPGNPRHGVLDRIPRQMGVARGRLHLRMTEQFPDHRQALAQGQRPRGRRVPEVKNSNILQPSARGCAARGAGDR